MIPETLLQVAREISASNLALPRGSGDARRDSSTAEDRIVGWLQNQNKWNIHSPNISAGNNRGWYDVKIDEYYCDIKVSELDSYDNTNAKNAVFYFLTGETGENGKKAPVQWGPFFEAMKQQEALSEDRDFYFIVVHKQRAQTFIVSLKGIAELKPAHNNPPFQCNWNNCRSPVQRNWEEARRYLLDVWAQTIKKGIETQRQGMPRYYPEFFR